MINIFRDFLKMQQLSRSFHGAFTDMGTQCRLMIFRYFKVRWYFDILINFKHWLRGNPYFQPRPRTPRSKTGSLRRWIFTRSLTTATTSSWRLPYALAQPLTNILRNLARLRKQYDDSWSWNGKRSNFFFEISDTAEWCVPLKSQRRLMCTDPPARSIVPTGAPRPAIWSPSSELHLFSVGKTNSISKLSKRCLWTITKCICAT